MAEAQQPNTSSSPDGGSLPWLTTSAVELIDPGPGPAVAQDYITGANVPDDDPDVVWPPRKPARMALLLTLLFVAIGGAAVVELHLPVQGELDRTTERLAAVQTDLVLSRAHAEKLAQTISTAAAARAALEEENARLDAAALAKKKRIEVLEGAKTALAERLAERVARQEVALAVRDDRLVVTLADRALFADPLTLGDPGKALLGEVAAAVRDFGPISVASYYDYVPSSVRTQHETTWHLTSARAATIVWFLENGAKIPATKMTPVGMGSARASRTRTAKRRVDLEIGAPAPR